MRNFCFVSYAHVLNTAGGGGSQPTRIRALLGALDQIVSYSKFVHD